MNQRIDEVSEPHIEIIKRAKGNGPKLGVFASSFNPPTIAHVELIRRAARTFTLDQTIVLAGQANADKVDYECPLEDRIEMVRLAFAEDDSVSIGISSHAFFVDMVDALIRVYSPGTDLHFIVGFDTFERVLDPQNQYTRRYYRRFTDRPEALGYLFGRSSFIVAGRAGAEGDSIRLLTEREPALPAERVFYLDFPSDLGELSATEVRDRRRSGKSITGLVPELVERYILEHALYAG